MLQLEDQIRSKEKEINDLEEILKENDERLKEAEVNSQSCLVEEINWNENTAKIQTIENVYTMTGVIVNLEENVYFNIFLRFVF